ncbi:transcriptional regulator PpsR [Thermaurantiacus sp.]
MDAQTPTMEPVPFRSPTQSLGGLSLDLAARLIAVASDVALVLDRNGTIRDMAVGHAELAEDGAEAWRGRTWAETVRPDSRSKVEEMLRPQSAEPPRWREVNQVTERGDRAVRYLALEAGEGVIAVGRDLREALLHQQRLIGMQQAVERDRLRARAAEQRYRLLFSESREALLVIEAQSRTILEANPAAEELVGEKRLDGRALTGLFRADERDRVIGFLGAVAVSDEAGPITLHLAGESAPVLVSGAPFREARAAFFLLRLTPASNGAHHPLAIERLLDRIPDAFVLTDRSGTIREVNGAFLELVGLARSENALGEPLTRFLARPSVDSARVADELARHGSVHNLPTIVRTRFGNTVDVELAAVTGSDGAWIGYSLRPKSSMRSLDDPAASAATRSVEELTELVGRLSLKEIVRESTDLIERLCIEAALKLADNNRASAAEILGLSRQGLYLKLYRHGLAGDDRSKS